MRPPASLPKPAVNSSRAERPFLRPFLARGGLRFPVSAQRYRLQVPFGASVSGGTNPVPNPTSQRARRLPGHVRTRMKWGETEGGSWNHTERRPRRRQPPATCPRDVARRSIPCDPARNGAACPACCDFFRFAGLGRTLLEGRGDALQIGVTLSMALFDAGDRINGRSRSNWQSAQDGSFPLPE